MGTGGAAVPQYHTRAAPGVNATAQAIFDRLNQFFEKHGIGWTKCKSVTTDGAAAMQRSTNGVIRKIKNVSPECVSNHCLIHREVLVVKT